MSTGEVKITYRVEYDHEVRAGYGGQSSKPKPWVAPDTESQTDAP